MSEIMMHGVLNMPLPEDPSELEPWDWLQFRYKARQASARIKELEAALKTARADALEEAAKAADALASKWWTEYKTAGHENAGSQHREGMSDGADEVANAIRAMKEKPSATKDATSGA